MRLLHLLLIVMVGCTPSLKTMSTEEVIDANRKCRETGLIPVYEQVSTKKWGIVCRPKD